ncbi:Transport and Golgi organization protein 2-like [Lachnellula arida]|uniref:Transport and Golgi organization protein 2-like n=1 Tax=Lachnellula arida TaxID=1316785 RepID=A0A8T9B888_9HELO|nr:Transport and Golgi organization protein 2-like [Lachnellula arida]
MCIALITTAHPDYALIILNNRDEFILRPTSRPHWWSSQHQDILSARDLQREEQGTWLGITKTGNFAVLTNYRENDTHDSEHPIEGSRSRGGMVTAWLTSPDNESTEHFVHRLLEGEGVKGVGGFSLVCGKLRKSKQAEQELEPLAIMSNRAGTPEDVPWIAGKKGEVYGLSNTFYDDPITWPKVKEGKEGVLAAVEEAVEEGLGEEELVKKLYALLDTDTLPPQDGQGFQEYTYQLRNSIFIPSIGDPELPKLIPQADRIATASKEAVVNGTNGDPETELEEDETPEAAANGVTGAYGTQRQTIILVDWEGNVTYRERSLWNEKGHPIEREKGDIKFNFKIDGWHSERKGNEVRPHALL